MQEDPSAIVFRLTILLLVVVAGWFVRRRAWLGDTATQILGRICVDVCFPCLTFVQMLRIVGDRPLRGQGHLLLIGMILMTVALCGGLWLLRGVAQPIRRSAWLAAAMPNWLFFPLPIAALFYGEDGLATVLLVNVTAQFYLWTTSVGILRGFRNTMRTGLIHLANPGLLATLAGALIAAFVPSSRTWLDAPGFTGHFWQLVEAVGAPTITLSMLVTGSQLGAIPRGWGMDRLSWRVLNARLIVLPGASLAALWALSHWIALSAETWRSAVMIAAMPVAVSCGVLVERYGGDRHFTSRAILVTTVGAVVTVPIWMYVAALVF
ncbi:MAG: AEC family transporter [Kiritimatiellae bacterium]|nr:AEC family transporter [Kiritimatiellia bacterium]MCO5069240.1 AEC family transporter [Kiritimatiellia bacterium]